MFAKVYTQTNTQRCTGSRCRARRGQALCNGQAHAVEAAAYERLEVLASTATNSRLPTTFEVVCALGGRAPAGVEAEGGEEVALDTYRTSSTATRSRAWSSSGCWPASPRSPFQAPRSRWASRPRPACRFG